MNCSGGDGSRQHSKAAERLGEQEAKGMQKQWVRALEKKGLADNITPVFTEKYFLN